jgi:phosphatidylglycerophosphatase A
MNDPLIFDAERRDRNVDNPADVSADASSPDAQDDRQDAQHALAGAAHDEPASAMPPHPAAGPAPGPGTGAGPSPSPGPGTGRFGRARQAAATGKTSGAATATARFMLSHPLHILSLGFGSGLSRVMPGTVGTLFGWLSFDALSGYLSAPEWAMLIVGGFAAGCWFTGFTARRLGVDDPSPVVWDEIVAFWLVLLFVTPASFAGQLGAFVVFRFFDMVKPPPIGYFDRRLHGGFGIMFDDLVAAFFALLAIALWRSL